MNQMRVPEIAIKPGAKAAHAAALQGADEGPRQYLTFVLGAEGFAIDILSIREIIEHAPLTQVPMMPAYVGGVINLRGAVVPVIDLAVRFGRAASAVSKRTCIVIIEVPNGEERQQVGLLVDAVNAVLDIAPSQIEPPPALAGASAEAQFVLGIGKAGERVVFLLDVARVLGNDAVAAA